METKPDSSKPSPTMTTLLNAFSDVFEEPKSLPPIRNCDHSIPLKEGIEPVNLKPYRYSFEQQNALESIIAEMVKSQVVEPSQSPFASPTLLVKKKDNTWRLCIDYRKLNSCTLKNKFPVPIVEDLVDELHGTTVYSKLDLGAGHHQVRMKEGEKKQDCI